MTTPSLLIRDALPEEADLVLEIWRAAFGEGDLRGERGDVERVMLETHRARLFIAEVDGRPVGALVATFDSWRGNLYRLAVLPEFRRRGIAAALVKQAEAWLHAVGCRRITALVEKGHPWTTGFWEAAGYAHEEQMARFVRNLA